MKFLNAHLFSKQRKCLDCYQYFSKTELSISLSVSVCLEQIMLFVKRFVYVCRVDWRITIYLWCLRDILTTVRVNKHEVNILMPKEKRLSRY